jgi:hypothetical protein
MKENNEDVGPVASLYYHIINNNFNVQFDPPESDTCNYYDKVKAELQRLSAERNNKFIKVINRQTNTLKSAKIT